MFSVGPMSYVLAVFAFRVANAALTATFFQPDEYFQALEPAHRLVFGYGYVTWEWHQRLRSAIHPLLYAAGYRLARSFGARAEAWAPCLVSAAIATATDIGAYRLAWRVTHSAATARVALLMSLASAWNWHVLPRAFLNNLEAALTAAALAQWPWRAVRARRLFALCVAAAVSCVVRPTNVLVWLFLGASLVRAHAGQWAHARHGWAHMARVAAVALGAAVVALAVGAAADRALYREWTLPLWNFVEFNVVRNLLVFYGAAPWHFYLAQGLPLMLMGYLPLWVVGSVRVVRQRHLSAACALLARMSGMVVFVVAVFLGIAHKEWRFLQPLYAPMLVVAAAEFQRWRASKNFAPRLVAAVVALHVVVAVFFSRVNERGVVDLVRALRHDPAVQSVGVLAPCHSTPWHSSMRRPELVAGLWFLTCEPPLHLAAGTVANMRLYRDELDRFFDDPAGFVAREIGTPLRPWPSHLVVFSPHAHAVLDAVQGTYYECARFFNSYFHWDDRRAGDIFVLCKAPHSPPTTETTGPAHSTN